MLLLATVAGALAAAGMNRDTVDPFLRSWGIEPDSAWFKEVLRFAFAIVVGGPLVALLWALFALGSDEAGQDIHGYTVLRLKPGMRITLSVLAVALAVLMIAGTLDTEQEALKWLFRAFAVAFLWGGWVIFTAKVRFDGATLFAPGPLGGQRKYDWADLVAIETLSDNREYRLVFRDKRKVKISFFYSGVDRLIWLANQKRQANARTP